MLTEQEVFKLIIQDHVHSLSYALHESSETYKDVKINDNLTTEQKTELQDLVQEYQDIFTDKPGSTYLEEHKVELTTTEPIRIAYGS